MNRYLSLVTFLGVIPFLSSCGDALVGSDSTCNAASHCHLVNGVPACDAGYVWQYPNDPENHNCVPVNPTTVAPDIATFAVTPSAAVSGVATEVLWSWTYANNPTPAPTCTIDNGVGDVTLGATTETTLTTDTVFTLTCTNSAGSDTAETTLTVVSAPVAPIIAGFTATPAAATTGVATAVTWSWTYANTPSPTPVCNIDNGIGNATSGAATDITLSSDTIFTLTCTNSAGSDTAETTVSVVAAPVAPVIATFTATPSAVTTSVATAVTWRWTYANTPTPAPTCAINNGVGNVTSGTATNITLTTGTTFTLSCDNSAGSNTAQTTVSVVSSSVAPVIATFTATPSAVVSDQWTTVTWHWTYANSPTPTPTCVIDLGVGTVASGATSNMALTTDQSFHLHCSNSAGSDTAQTTVTVVSAPAAPIIATFTATPSVVTTGVPTAVTWAWTYANTPTPAPTCVVAPGVGTVTNGAVTNITLTTNATFTLTCINSAGSDTEQTTVETVAAPVAPVIAGFSVAPSSVTIGMATPVTWVWTYANSPTPTPTCTIDNGVGTVTSGTTTNITLTEDTTFRLICTNVAGSSSGWEVTVRVVAAPVAPIIGTFAVTPSAVTMGVATNLTWTWTYTNSPSPAPVCSINNGVGTVTSGTVTPMTLATDTDFTLTCTNSAGNDTAQAMVSAVCEEGAARRGSTSCGPTGAVLEQECIGGAWEDTANCITMPVVSVGFNAMCVTYGGEARCWGTNHCAELGDGTRATRYTPVFANLDGYVEQMWPGICTSCAALDDGTLRCAGADTGHDDMVVREHHAAVPGLGVKATFGQDHACAIDASGDVWCWGENDNGELGNNSTEPSLVPVKVRNVADAIEVGSQYNDSCALLSTGEVKCWGWLADGLKTVLPSDAVTMGVGYYKVCAVMADGDVQCRGFSTSSPAQEMGLTGAVDVAMGDQHACAVLNNGEVWCWGEDYYGELGNGPGTQSSETPVRTNLITNAISISANDNTTCAVLDDLRVMCWGGSSILGDGDPYGYGSDVPVEVLFCNSGFNDVTCVDPETCTTGDLRPGQTPCGANDRGVMEQICAANQWADTTTCIEPYAINQITANRKHTCAIGKVGQMQCWGSDENGQLGLGSSGTLLPNPGTVWGPPTFVEISAGGNHTCGRTREGDVYCWGNNQYGQLGGGYDLSTRYSRPQPVIGISNAVQISAGHEHTCALLASGIIKCWGIQSYCQTGFYSSDDYPGEVPNITNAIEVAAGYEHTCALLSTGVIKCWGMGDSGQLGDNEFQTSVTGYGECTPQTVRNITDAVAIGLGASHSCAVLATDGRVQCWGENNSGQLGDGGPDDSAIPINAWGMTSAVRVWGGYDHTCALMDDDTVRCWGNNAYGQLGKGDTDPRVRPVIVDNLSGVLDVATGGIHSCAMMFSGDVKCWGDNEFGELGDGTFTSHSTVTPVWSEP